MTEARWGYAGIPVKFEVTTRDEKGREMTTCQSIPRGDHRVWIPKEALTF
ncbi:hypothetical protein SEA_BAJUNIPER_15 [Microbacterium phage BAjuniper]|nr:hypothetical protein SEA_BAJUNIPER_15 [Microbacterium phage BAjuniper]